MAFTKRVVFAFLLICGLAFIDRILLNIGLDLAVLETTGLFVLSLCVFAYVKVVMLCFPFFDKGYDVLQEKISDFILDYIFNIHQR